MTEESTLMTEQEAAEYLKMSAGTLRNWRSKHPERIPARKNGRMIRYDRAVVEQFFKSKKPAVAAAGQNN